jgi:hypothetical protein
MDLLTVGLPTVSPVHFHTGFAASAMQVHGEPSVES